jgi:hypothetical protein
MGPKDASKIPRRLLPSPPASPDRDKNGSVGGTAKSEVELHPSPNSSNKAASPNKGIAAKRRNHHSRIITLKYRKALSASSEITPPRSPEEEAEKGQGASPSKSDSAAAPTGAQQSEPCHSYGLRSSAPKLTFKVKFSDPEGQTTAAKIVRGPPTTKNNHNLRPQEGPPIINIPEPTGNKNPAYDDLLKIYSSAPHLKPKLAALKKKGNKRSSTYEAWDSKTECQPVMNKRDLTRTVNHYLKWPGQNPDMGGPNPIEVNPKYYDQVNYIRVDPTIDNFIEPPEPGTFDNQIILSRTQRAALDKKHMDPKGLKTLDSFILQAKKEAGEDWIDAKEILYYPRSKPLFFDGKKKIMKNAHLDIDIAICNKRINLKLQEIRLNPTKFGCKKLPWTDKYEDKLLKLIVKGTFDEERKPNENRTSTRQYFENLKKNQGIDFVEPTSERLLDSKTKPPPGVKPSQIGKDFYWSEREVFNGGMLPVPKRARTLDPSN